MTARRVKAVVRVVIYTRISQQETSGTPEADRQEFEIREALDAQYGPDGWELVAQHYDAESAWKRDRRTGQLRPRPGFESVLDLARRRAVDCVATWSADRLVRITAVVDQIIDALGQDPRDGVDWITAVDDRVNLTTASGRKKARDQASDAEYESDRKAERVRSANRHGARQGWAPAVACYGYRREDWGAKRGATFHQVPEEAAHIATIVGLVLDGEDPLTLSEAAEWMNRAGHLRRGKPWTGDFLRKLFLSPSLAGIIVYEEEEYVGNWTPIIAPAVWNELCAQLASPAHRKPRRSRAHYWARLVDPNGHRMTGGRTTTWDPSTLRHGESSRRIYRTGPNYKQPGQRSVNIDAEAVEAFLLDVVGANIKLLAEWTPEPVAAAPVGLAEAEAEVTRLEEALADLMRERLAGEVTMAEWRAGAATERERLAAAKAEVKAQRRASSRGRLPVLAELVGRWELPEGHADALTDVQRQTIVHAVLGDVTVLPASASGCGQFRTTRQAVGARLVLDPESVFARAVGGFR
jgi:DNA invertase Pin-like site-specific DNA recombinase